MRQTRGTATVTADLFFAVAAASSRPCIHGLLLRCYYGCVVRIPALEP
jgi:hypothetical protein